MDDSTIERSDLEIVGHMSAIGVADPMSEITFTRFSDSVVADQSRPEAIRIVGHLPLSTAYPAQPKTVQATERSPAPSLGSGLALSAHLTLGSRRRARRVRRGWRSLLNGVCSFD